MKVPARKQGNGTCHVVVGFHVATSMKVPARKRRNRLPESYPEPYVPVLNESSHPKVEKSCVNGVLATVLAWPQ